MRGKHHEHPKIVGDRSTAFVLARLLEIYETVLLPFGENQRYDLVVEDGDTFLRVQCKTGRLVKGAVIFPACSSSYHHPNRSSVKFLSMPYRGEADFFGVYCPDTAGVYLVPVDEIGIRMGSLRVDRPRNGQERRIRWASDYEIRGRRNAMESGPNSPDTLFEAPQPYAVAR